MKPEADGREGARNNDNETGWMGIARPLPAD